MPGETEKEPSAFTIDSLHYLVRTMVDERDRRYEQRFDAQEKAVAAALASAERANAKSETDADKRFESVNEFRAQQADLIARFMPRTEADQRMLSIEKAINQLDNWRSKATGAAALGMLMAGVIGAAILKAFGG